VHVVGKVDGAIFYVCVDEPGAAESDSGIVEAHRSNRFRGEQQEDAEQHRQQEGQPASTKHAQQCILTEWSESAKKGSKENVGLHIRTQNFQCCIGN
jgi:hypothetical protein